MSDVGSSSKKVMGEKKVVRDNYMMGTRDSKIKDGEDVDVLISPDFYSTKK